MTIRTRLTLWYAGLIIVSLLAMGLLSYHEFVLEPRQKNSPAALAGKQVAEEESDFREVFTILIACGFPAAALALTGGWWLMRKALKPVAALTLAAQAINERNLGERLPRSGNGDEFDRLTEVFNAMMARLDNSFQQIREFTLHASHELKTPLTIVHGELETALEEAPAAGAERERLLSQLDEIQRLAKIVDGLTLLTRADAGLVALSREPVRLDELVREAFEDAQVLARPARVKVQLDDCQDVTVAGDRHRLRQLLLNLSDNAIKYNHPEGTVKMGLSRANGHAVLTIQNTGQPIPPEILPRLYERFFRGDPAHGNQVEGSGLGLSIAQWIVTAHHGSIKVASDAPGGTIATVHLPILKSSPEN
jgi:signal transduction histidine kinase